MTSGASHIFYASGCPFANLLRAPLVGTIFSQEPRGCGKEMKILLTGGTGFVGPSLASRLAKEGHEVTVLIRPGERARVGSTGIAFLEGDPIQRGPWQEAVGDHDGAVNLAGASIFTRWTHERKEADTGEQALHDEEPRGGHQGTDQKARTLSGGEQQMLAIGRALMAKPKLLLMDEPSLGLAPKVVYELGLIIEDIRKQEGMSILLVEQNLGLARQLATRGYLLQVGRVVSEGNIGDLEKSDVVKRAYLGGNRRTRRSPSP